ncbi:MAG: hypothetical protein RIR70_2141 [Pseudomonadota bacterium]|jgi:uncharacterized protein (DUF934 family)
MSEIIVNGAVVQDTWQLVRLPVRDEPVQKQAGKVVVMKVTGTQAATAEEAASVVIPAGRVIVPLVVWLHRKAELTERLDAGELGVWLESFETIETLIDSLDNLNRLPVIALNFPKFVDGRHYSTAVMLRTRLGYTGEIRAIGDVLRDQLFFMNQVGFNAFAVRADRDIHDALLGLKDFTEPYLGSTENRAPLFRRRARGGKA